MKIGYILIMLMFLPIVQGAILQGTVYNIDFESVDNVQVEIDTEPQQRTITQNGEYRFTVPPGTYMISAAAYEEGVLVMDTNETITVSQEGDFTLDLLLFPTFEAEELEDFEIIEDEEILAEKDHSWILYLFLGGISIAGVVFFILRKKEAPEELEEVKQLLDFLKKEGGRATQKEIRKAFPFSEAKISLLITELEQKGYITKIKKGRSNVVILK